MGKAMSSRLERRPDIRRAEAQVVAATAGLREAKAELFPRFGPHWQRGTSGLAIARFDFGIGELLCRPGGSVCPYLTEGGFVPTSRSRARGSATLISHQSTILTALE